MNWWKPLLISTSPKKGKIYIGSEDYKVLNSESLIKRRICKLSFKRVLRWVNLCSWLGMSHTILRMIFLRSFRYKRHGPVLQLFRTTFGCLKCLRLRTFQRYDLFFGLIPSHFFVMVDSFPFEFIIICGLMAFQIHVLMIFICIEAYFIPQYQNNCQHTHSRTHALTHTKFNGPKWKRKN